MFGLFKRGPFSKDEVRTILRFACGEALLENEVRAIHRAHRDDRVKTLLHRFIALFDVAEGRADKCERAALRLAVLRAY